MRSIGPALLFVLALAPAAGAQEVTAAVSRYQPFGLNDLDGQLPVMAELRFAMPLADRFALEPFVTAGSRTRRQRAVLEGLYGAQIRQRFVRLSTNHAYIFATYGVSAYFSGSESTFPLIGHFGLGLNRRVSKHASFRPEVQIVTFHVVPIGVRLVAGLSVN